MGLFWDLYQQNQLSQHSSRADSLEQRLAYLEDHVRWQDNFMRELIIRLEKHLGTDVDGDGRVG